MKCSKENCGGVLLVEAELGDKKQRTRCNKCGITEVRNASGQRLLTDSGVAPSSPKLLLG